MRKAQKQELLECINSLHQAHMEIRQALQQHNRDAVQNMLSECQEFAATLGENIEKTEGEGHITVSHVEEYCESLFRVFEEITKGQANENRICKILKRQLLRVENSVKNDIPVKMEIAFFPYKASMWDSLESVYLAAREDPECDAYCVPIPYYDLNPDRSFGKMHYEGDEYPENIEITDWQSYQFEERKPDVIYIHNPYDNYNLVTSVHPRYYASNLKKYTETLVYIPYYVTSGRMQEAQSLLPAYLYADYIVIQSPQFRECFDKNIPDEKFLPFGSPKVDKVINKCKNPPEPPEEWTEKMTGKDGRRKKVFFYNTSINGMLADTENFLKKMKYVFTCFEGRKDVCILWRPHPLLESTFEAMRPEYRSVYDKLKNSFLENKLGIYDTTPDIEESIALSDAYIGDAGTSVISLFGVAGKPIFILNDKILEEPGEEDWRKEIPAYFDYQERDRFNIIQGGKLYISQPERYAYRYFCDLAEGGYRNDYFTVHEINGKLYACSYGTQDIFVIGKRGIEKKIALEKWSGGRTAFSYSRKSDRYLFLLPLNYPAVVRYDTVTGEIRYFTENIEVVVKEKNGQKITSGALIYRKMLYIMSPTDNKVYQLEIESGESHIIELPIQSRCGGHGVFEYNGEIWIMPYDGQVVVRWNPITYEIREYEGFPEGFACKNPLDDSMCTENPFCIPAFCGEYVYLLACWANMSLRLNINTGEFQQWIPAYEKDSKQREYCMFLHWKPDKYDNSFRVYSSSRHKIYWMHLEEDTFEEMEIKFDRKELEDNEPGFCKYSESLPYACIENYFNTLSRFLGGKMVGNQFDVEKQSAAYREIITNCDGGCGKRIHEYVRIRFINP